jgi:GTP-binding protein
VVLYVLDGAAGLSPADADAARALRRRHPTMLFVLNKLDSSARQAAATDFWALGADDLLQVSAEHGLGVADLVETIVARLPEPGEATAAAPDAPVAVALIGRPNVGKSSLVNRLLGYQRSLVDAVAGTTRDAVDTLLEDRDRRYRLVDTAGLRRRSRVQEGLERSATAKSLETLARADVAVIVLDAAEGVTAQDQRLASRAWEAGRSLVVVANKADLLVQPAAAFVEDVRRALGRLAGVPVVPTSAVTGAGVEAILPAVDRVAAAHARELKTRKLNDVLTAAVRAQEPPLVGSRRPRIFYATQTGRRPPEVTIFVSNPEAIHPSYQRYLENHVATAFGLVGTPLRLRLRGRR